MHLVASRCLSADCSGCMRIQLFEANFQWSIVRLGVVVGCECGCRRRVSEHHASLQHIRNCTGSVALGEEESRSHTYRSRLRRLGSKATIKYLEILFRYKQRIDSDSFEYITRITVHSESRSKSYPLRSLGILVLSVGLGLGLYQLFSVQCVKTTTCSL
jgi:hypothetical protein